jgi:hypothetical protein
MGGRRGEQDQKFRSHFDFEFEPLLLIIQKNSNHRFRKAVLKGLQTKVTRVRPQFITFIIISIEYFRKIEVSRLVVWSSLAKQTMMVNALQEE